MNDAEKTTHKKILACFGVWLVGWFGRPVLYAVGVGAYGPYAKGLAIAGAIAMLTIPFIDGEIDNEG